MIIGAYLEPYELVDWRDESLVSIAEWRGMSVMPINHDPCTSLADMVESAKQLRKILEGSNG